MLQPGDFLDPIQAAVLGVPATNAYAIWPGLDAGGGMGSLGGAQQPGQQPQSGGSGLLNSLGQEGGFAPFARQFSNWATPPMQHTPSPLGGMLNDPGALNALFQQRGWGGFQPVDYNPMPQSWASQSIPNRMTMKQLFPNAGQDTGKK